MPDLFLMEKFEMEKELSKHSHHFRRNILFMTESGSKLSVIYGGFGNDQLVLCKV